MKVKPQVMCLRFFIVDDIISIMEINLTTPALLFPTISLLMLAYTNRFLTLATIIRNLYDRYNAEHNDNLLSQIANLRYRTYLIL